MTNVKPVSEGLVPEHLWLILDGNRRWAKDKGLPTLEGHKRGYENLKTIAEEAFDSGVKYVSAFVFSNENWNRSKEEVGYLMKLVVSVVAKDLNKLIDKNVKVIFLGSRDRLSKDVLKAIDTAEEKSKSKTGGVLALCLNYGGQQEIVSAVNRIIKDGKTDNVTEVTLNNYLFHPELPPVDYMIRTSGEKRISNFMLWRMSYAEMHFVDMHWPAFSKNDLHEALEEYARRQRRFGK